MSKSTHADFLSKPSPARIRKEIENICDSYSHPWDLLSELCQNAVDAIQLHKKRYGESSKKHSISIVINSRERSVEVTDTGRTLGLLRDIARSWQPSRLAALW